MDGHHRRGPRHRGRWPCRRASSRMVLEPPRARAKRATGARTSPRRSTERGLGGDAVDLAIRLDAFRRDRLARAEDARRLARGLAARASEAVALIRRSATFSPAEKGAPPSPSGRGVGGEVSAGVLLASAFPDRIAAARGRRGEFLMANGRAAALEAHDPLAGEHVSRHRRNRRSRRLGPDPHGCGADPRRHRKDCRRVNRKRGRIELRSRLRVVAGAPPRRNSARLSSPSRRFAFHRTRRLRLRSGTAFFRSGSRACRGPKRSSSAEIG